jgi:hypothetical protein
MVVEREELPGGAILFHLGVLLLKDIKLVQINELIT